MKKLSKMGSAKDLPTTEQRGRLRTKSLRPPTFSIPVCASSRGDPPLQPLCHSPFPPPNPAKPLAPSTSYRRRKVRIAAIISFAGVVGCLFFGQLCPANPQLSTLNPQPPDRAHQPSTLNHQPFLAQLPAPDPVHFTNWLA